MIYEQRSAETEKEMKRRKREVGQARKRIAELDRIFKRIYEDDISSAISHERFLKLSAEYEAAQRELEEKVKADGNNFPFCHAIQTARRIETRKDGTALEMGAIPSNLKLLPSNRKHLISRVFEQF